MEKIRVNLGERSYDIVVQAGGLAEVGRWMSGFSLPPHVLVVADDNTSALFGAAALESMKCAGFSPVLAPIPAGESSKSLRMADQLYEAAIRAGLDRNCAIVALGGGVVGDLAGFVAATYLRGVPFLQVPTTLLAQVDSSVGGKVAVNHTLGKNLIGAFYQPRGVLIDPQTLVSLPEREFASGMAEVIKYGLILDHEFFADLNADALERVAAMFDPQTNTRAILDFFAATSGRGRGRWQGRGGRPPQRRGLDPAGHGGEHHAHVEGFGDVVVHAGL